MVQWIKETIVKIISDALNKKIKLFRRDIKSKKIHTCICAKKRK